MHITERGFTKTFPFYRLVNGHRYHEITGMLPLVEEKYSSCKSCNILQDNALFLQNFAKSWKILARNVFLLLLLLLLFQALVVAHPGLIWVFADAKCIPCKILPNNGFLARFL